MTGFASELEKIPAFLLGGPMGWGAVECFRDWLWVRGSRRRLPAVWVTDSFEVCEAPEMVGVDTVGSLV